MDWLNAIADTLLLFYFAAFSWVPPIVGLTILAALAGAGILWVVRATSDQARLKTVKNRVWAALFELRVYAGDPRVTWRAQKSLFSANLSYLALALKPALWLALPTIFLLLHLESFYQRAPLPVGRPAIVIMAMSSPWTATSSVPELTAPPEVRVEGPPVRALDSREISWRIEPVYPVSGKLTFLVDGRPVGKMIEAGVRQRFVPGRSVSSPIQVLWNPGERNIPDQRVEWVEIRYPPASMDVFGIHCNWLVWFFLVSMVTALLLKKRFGVVI
jgi:uncharacterized membrane protein (DUF106 family)